MMLRLSDQHSRCKCYKWRRPTPSGDGKALHVLSSKEMGKVINKRLSPKLITAHITQIFHSQHILLLQNWTSPRRSPKRFQQSEKCLLGNLTRFSPHPVSAQQRGKLQQHMRIKTGGIRKSKMYVEWRSLNPVSAVMSSGDVCETVYNFYLCVYLSANTFSWLYFSKYKN